MKSFPKKLTYLFLLFSSLSYAQLLQYVSLGVSQSEIVDEKNKGYIFNYGVSVHQEKSIYGAFEAKIEKSEHKNKRVSSYGGNIKFGYTPIDKFSLYAIGSLMAQNIFNTRTSGFGYGGGLEYRIFDSFAINYEYITHRMIHAKARDYDYSISSVGVKYLF